MVLLEKLWDDVLAGPQPERGLGKFRKISTKPINIPAPGIQQLRKEKFNLNVLKKITNCHLSYKFLLDKSMCFDVLYMIIEILCLHILFGCMVLDVDIGEGSKFQRSLSMPASPAVPVTPTTPASARKENVWRSVFHPGSNLATKKIGSQYFDKPQPNSPTVYDWYVVYITLAYPNTCMLLGRAMIWLFIHQI